MSELGLEIAKEKIRRLGLLEFVRFFWDAVESCDYCEEPHMPLICRHLEACALRATSSFRLKPQPWTENLDPIKDLCISVPPGHSKSLLTNVFFPAWLWTFAPQTKLITVSYSEQLVTRDAKRSFELMNTDRYRTMYPNVEIVGGERASMQFYQTTAKGMRLAQPLAGQATGFHCHILLCDDGIKPSDLDVNPAEALAKAVERWDGTFSSRSAHPASFTRVIIAQRLHTEDLTGVMERRGAQVVFLPIEFVPERAYKSPWGDDWRSEPGELLTPLRFPEDVITARKTVLARRIWSAQYQQMPVPDGGNIFENAWFQHRYSGCPWGNAGIVLSIDASNKETATSDFFVCQAWARQGGKCYLIDQIRKRAGFQEQVDAIRVMRGRYANPRQILVEEKSSGNAIIDVLRRQFPGVVAVNPQGGKESRMNACTWLWSTGSVLLPEKASWVEDFIEEHLVAPVGRHDDQCDAASQYLNWAFTKDRNDLFKQAMAKQRERFSDSWSKRTLY